MIATGWVNQSSHLSTNKLRKYWTSTIALEGEGSGKRGLPRQVDESEIVAQWSSVFLISDKVQPTNQGAS